MDPKTAQIYRDIYKFLQKANLVGTEVQAWINCSNFVSEILKKEDTNADNKPG